MRIGLSIFLVLMSLTMASAQQDTFVYNDHGKRDPFWRLVSPSGSIINYEKDLLISDMVLEGIMMDSHGHNIAIINGTVVKEGDKLGLFTIQKIDPLTITLQKGEETFTLNLKKEDQHD